MAVLEIHLRLEDKIHWYSDGKKRFESSGSTSKNVAERLLIQCKKEVMDGKDHIKKIPNYTFRELAGEYLKWAERQKSFQSKVYLMKQLIDTFGNLQLKRFTSMTLEQYQTAKLQKGNKHATANRFLATIKHMFTKAVEWDMVEEGILKRIGKVKFSEENNRRLRYLSKDECKRLIDSCEPHLQQFPNSLVYP